MSPCRFARSHRRARREGLGVLGQNGIDLDRMQTVLVGLRQRLARAPHPLGVQAALRGARARGRILAVLVLHRSELVSTVDFERDAAIGQGERVEHERLELEARYGGLESAL